MSAIKEEEEKKLDYISWLLNTPNGKRLQMARAIHVRILGNLIDIRSTTRKGHEREIRELQEINWKLEQEGKLIKSNLEIIRVLQIHNKKEREMETEVGLFLNSFPPVRSVSSSSSSSSSSLSLSHS